MGGGGGTVRIGKAGNAAADETIGMVVGAEGVGAVPVVAMASRASRDFSATTSKR